MKIRTQLMMINLISLGLMVGVLLYSYHGMLLNFSQTRLLTICTISASLFSFIAYWVMTTPIVSSLHKLTKRAEQMAERKFQNTMTTSEGPAEVKQLAVAFHKMSERLELSFQQLEEGERLRRELIMNISHDLRTPLASIQSYVEALQDEVLEDTVTKNQYLTTIHVETRRLGGLIQDLFELSVLDAEQQKFEPQLTHLDQVLLEVLESHRLLLREKKLQLTVDVDEHLPPLRIMPQKIGRVLGNLMQNAIRYSPVNGTIELQVIYRAESAEVEVCLRDQGKGVPMEAQAYIFEQFVRTDQSRNRESGGAGIGLAIARSLVELHGGRIGMRDRLSGTGSEFWFTLPTL